MILSHFIFALVVSLRETIDKFSKTRVFKTMKLKGSSYLVLSIINPISIFYFIEVKQIEPLKKFLNCLFKITLFKNRQSLLCVVFVSW